MLKKRFSLIASVIFLFAISCISCSKDHGIHTSFSKGILSARNNFLEMSLNISTGTIELRDKEGRLVLKGTSDYSITNGKVLKGTYNYDLEKIKIVSPADYNEHRWSERTTYSSKGEGREFIITHSVYSGYPDLIQKIKVDKEGTAIFVSMSLSSSEKLVTAPLLISELRVLGFEMTEKERHWFTPVKKNVIMERQGTRRPSDRRVIVTLDNEKFPEDYNYGGYNSYMRRETDKELKYISESLTSLIHSENHHTLFMGFVTQHDQATQIIARRIKNDPEYLGVSCRCDIEGNPFSGKQILGSEVLMVDFVSVPKIVKEAYVEEIKERHGQPKGRELVAAGWEGWSYYRKYVTEDEVIKNMDAIKELGIPIEYIRLNSGWENIEDWLLGANFRFPHGLKWLADEIRKRGFKPSIWINPFITFTESKLSKQHPEYMVRDKNGKLLEAHKHNLGIYEASGAPTLPVYTIDYTIPGARENLRNAIHTLAHEWGWKYLKIDGPWRDIYYEKVPRGPLSDPTVTTIGNFTIAYKIIREVLGEGDDVNIFGCGGYFGPSYGNANSHAVSQDWSPNWKTELSHMLSSNLSIYPWPCTDYNFRSGYIISYKPSPLFEKWILQEEISDGVTRINYTTLALEQKKLMSLYGKVHSLSAEDEKRLHQYLPTYSGETKIVDGLPEYLPILSREGSREKKITCSWGEWSILGLLNHSPEKEAEISLPINSLSVPQGSRYYNVFDFWREKYFGKFEREIKVKVPPADALMLTIRPVSGHPEILSTNMHYTQGAVELKDVTWDDRDMKLHFSSDFDYQIDVKIFIYVPENYIISDIKSSGVDDLKNKIEGDLLTLSYKKGEAKTDFTILFGKR
jgi:hypothetical protein